MTSVPTQLLRERFPVLRTGDTPGERVGECPCIHEGAAEATFPVRDLGDGTWSIQLCDLGCTPQAIWDGAEPLDRPEPGEDRPEAEAAPRTLADRFVKLSRDGLRSKPVDREYMLRDANSGDGVFIQGRVGLLAASGGTGKTWSLAQLAVSLATGHTWFGPGGWAPVKTGRVFLALAEEEPEEVLRMLHFAARAAGAISDEDIDAVVARVRQFDATGLNVALSNSENDDVTLPETPFARALRSEIEAAATAGDPYIALILDPLSYFAGFDVEKDNAAATRWIQVVRTLTTPACGRASVIVAHHEKKKAEGDDPDSADAIRGASALKDGARWAARLSQEKQSEGAADILTLRLVKRNGLPRHEPLRLCRSEYEGVLRVATHDEIASHDGVSRQVERATEKLQKYIDYILENIDYGEIVNTNEFVNNAPHQRKPMLAAVRNVVDNKLFCRAHKGHLQRLVPAGSGPVPGTMVPVLVPVKSPKGTNPGNQEPDEKTAVPGFGSGNQKEDRP